MDKKLLWWIFGVTRGGPVRAEIVRYLKDRPSNASQLAQELHLDYKTVRYHLDILLQHKIVTPSEGTYVIMYFISDEIEKNFADFLEIYNKLKK